MRARTVSAALALVATAPAVAVGLGPLSKEAVIDGPRQAFYLTLYNPYAENADFTAVPIGWDNEVAETRVTVLPAETTLGSLRTRQLLVIADGLAPGETYKFRVCAQRKHPTEGFTLNARVCSKLSARRIG